MGTVLGVFGTVDLSTERFLGSYRSTVDRQSLIGIEESVLRLQSPVWPDELGTIDAGERESGRVLFDDHCAECHTNNGTEYTFDRTDPDRFVVARMRDVGTDSEMFLNFALRQAKTGVLQGARFREF